MNEHSGENQSLWMTASIPQFPQLKENIRADVCIVGAGIAGLSTAYMLAREKKSVVVLDDGPICSGETERTTAHLSNAFDDRYFEMEKLHGLRGAQLIADSHTSAITRIEANVKDEKIDCDFTRVSGYLFVPPGDTTSILEKERDACLRAGLSDVEFISRAPLSDFDTGPCLHFPRQAQFHPLKYLRALALAIIRMGGRIYAATHVEDMKGGLPAEVTTANGKTVKCDAIVVATNSPVNDMVAIHTKQAPYRTYVIGARIPRGYVPQSLFWDTMTPYHYVRIQPGDAKESDYDVLIVGGEDHKTGQPDKLSAPFMELEQWARRRFPKMGNIEFRWSGQVLEPVDGLAFIGRNPMDKDNVFICTGDSGQGMTHGTIASMLLTDLIMGRPNEWESLYDPSRIRLRAAGDFARENLNVAKKYGEWVEGGDVDNVDDIPPGGGAVIRRGMKKIAVFRSENGEVYQHSAKCPHLGCVVHWNNVEKTWDCPCHGSRFDKFGSVINGPAITDLAPIPTEEPAKD